MSDVVVLGRNYTSRLGMIRAAGVAGNDVYVVKTEKRTGYKKCKIDESSKYVKGYYCVPEPDSEGLIRLLNKLFSNRKETVVLLPTDDYTASAIDLYQEQLDSCFVYPHINHTVGEVVKYMDKGRQKELAIQAGLAVPACWTAVFENDRYIIPENIIYPCFTKPKVSFQGSKFFMKRCNSREELQSLLNEITNKSRCPILIEQFIEIEKEYDIPGFSDGKKVVIPGVIEKGFIHLGVTATGTMRSRSTIEDIAKKLEEFVRMIGFVGLIDIELYESNGEVYFNELNLRLGASGYAATKTFGNLPELLINCLKGQELNLEKINNSFEPKTFASEKVCSQLLNANVLSWSQFWDLLRNVDFGFIKSQDDVVPYKYFCIDVGILRIKKIGKQLIRK